MDDRSCAEVNIYRDKFCNKNYIIQPYSLSNSTLTVVMNQHYKNLLMDTFKECAENAPFFEKFELPLGPIHLILDKCQISTDNLPSYMNEGCYKVEVNFYGQVEVKVSMYSVVERVN